jgi:myo-inositol-1(or 4)-monophosphatase
MEVGSLLYFAGAPDHVIAAGVMHELIEKAGVSAADIRTQFGERIAGLVLAVSDDDGIEGYTRRKTALRGQVAAAGEEALSLVAADKLSKVRELRREAAAQSEDGVSGRRTQVRARRLGHYQRSLAMLEERLPESPLVRELRDELGVLTRELHGPKLAGLR